MIKINMNRSKEQQPVAQEQPIPVKPPTMIETMKIQLADIDMQIRALMRRRNEMSEHILWAEMTPDIEARMRFIWERIKPQP
jgi:hypothetical protein